MEDSFRNAAPPHGKSPFMPRDTIFVRHLSMCTLHSMGCKGSPYRSCLRYPLQRRVHEPVNEPIRTTKEGDVASSKASVCSEASVIPTALPRFSSSCRNLRGPTVRTHRHRFSYSRSQHTSDLGHRRRILFAESRAFSSTSRNPCSLSKGSKSSLRESRSSALDIFASELARQESKGQRAPHRQTDSIIRHHRHHVALDVAPQ